MNPSREGANLLESVEATMASTAPRLILRFDLPNEDDELTGWEIHDAGALPGAIEDYIVSLRICCPEQEDDADFDDELEDDLIT